MRLYIFVLLFTIGASEVFSQTCEVTAIKLKPGTEFYNTEDSTISYPIVRTSDTKVNDKINHYIRTKLIDSEYEDKSIDDALRASASEGLISMSYLITFNHNGILSITVEAEVCRAYCSAWSTYFNFDLKTGLVIPIGSLLKEKSISRFRDKVYGDKVVALNKYKKEMREWFIKNEIDSDTYNWAIQEVDINCIKEIRLENYSLTDSSIEIVDDCEFPHAMQSQSLVYDLIYNFQYMKGYLKEEHFNKLTIKK